MLCKNINMITVLSNNFFVVVESRFFGCKTTQCCYDCYAPEVLWLRQTHGEKNGRAKYIMG